MGKEVSGKGKEGSVVPQWHRPITQHTDVSLNFYVSQVQSALPELPTGWSGRWPLTSGTLCCFANVSMALLKAMKQQLVNNLIQVPQYCTKQNILSFPGQGRQVPAILHALQHK